MSMGRGGLQKYMGNGNNPIQNGGMGYGIGMPQTNGQNYSNGARDDSHSLFSNNSMGLMGLAGIGGQLANGLFNNNYQNPSNSAAGPLNQISEDAQSYNPYIDSGQRAMHSNEDLYNQLISNPGNELNKIGQGYHQSPGYQNALREAMRGVDNFQGSRGMSGGEGQLMGRMGVASNFANQDYHNWMNDALGLYDKGIQGRGHLQDTGYNANNEKTTDLMNQHLSQAQLQYEGQNTKNQESDPFSSLFSGISSALPFLSLL